MADNISIHCSYDKLVKIDELKPHHQNRNKHPADQIDRLAKIIQYQGIRAPIKVSRRSNLITAGHGRLEAFRRLKLKEVPVNYQDYETEEQEYADLQSDNAIASWAELDLSGINADIPNLGPDFDLDLLGIKDFVLEPADKMAGCDEDEVPEKVEATAKLGDIWSLGDHRMMCGDSTSIDAVENLLGWDKAPGKHIDMVFTSPPYGVGLDYETYNDSFAETKKLVSDVIVSLYDKVEGYICLNWGDIVAAKGINNTTFPSQFSWLPHYDQTLRALGFFLYGQRIWKKPHARCSGIWSASSNRPVTDWEYLFTWSNGGQKYKMRGNESHFGIIDSSESKQTDTLLKHPGAFPVMIPERMVLIHTDVEHSVYDPFGGSGSTLIACEKTNRKCFMMEIDPHYCDVIVARWEKYTGKKAELINGKT